MNTTSSKNNTQMDGMESRWYLAPGQTLYNTNISDREHALHATATAWKKINAHLDRNKLIAEVLEKERAYKKAMKEGSDGMTRNWDDTIERAHNKKVEEKRQRAKELENEKAQKYMELTKEQENIKQAYIQKVQDSMYYSRAYPKMLNGALLESEVIYERQKQMEFKEKLRQYDLEQGRIYGEKVKQDAEDEKREELEKKMEGFKKKQQLKQINEKEINIKKEFIKSQREKRKQQQILENLNQQEEIELEEKIKREDILKFREQKRKELLEYIAKDKAHKAHLAKEEAEVEECIRIFDEAKRNIDCLRKQREKEIHMETIEKREAAGSLVYAEEQAKDEAFIRNIEKVQEEAARKEEEKRQEKIQKQIQLRNDRESDRREHLEREEQEKIRRKEIMRWEMLNRQKQEATTKEYLNGKRKEEWQRTLEYRQTLLNQIEEKKAKEREEKEEMLNTESYAKAKQDDEKFFAYAKKLLERCEEKNRPTYPILKVMAHYRHENALEETRDSECEPYDKYVKRREKMVNNTPGKILHHPRSDPNYRRCRCQKERLYK